MSFISESVFTDAFDYSARRNRKDLDGNVDAGRAMISRLRLDAMLFNKIILTDVQVFHSLFLSGLASLSFRGETIFSRIPLESIEIKAVNGNLEQSLLARIRGKDGVLYPHLFTYIDPKNEIIKREFKNIKSSTVNTWMDLADLLKRITLGDESEDRARRSIEGWAFWFASSQDKASGLKVTPWREFDFTGTANANLQAILGNMADSERLSLDTGVLNEVSLGVKSRGEVVAQLMAETEKRTISETEFNDLQLADAIYSLAYNKAVAEQHECTASDTNFRYLAAHADKGNLTRTDVSGKDVQVAELPAEFLIALGDMPSKAYNDFRTMQSNNRAVMWEEHHSPTLKVMCEQLIEIANKFGLSANARDNVNAKLSATNSSRRTFGTFIDAGVAGLEVLIGDMLPQIGASGKLVAAMGAALIGAVLKSDIEEVDDDYLATSLVDFAKARMGWETHT